MNPFKWTFKAIGAVVAHSTNVIERIPSQTGNGIRACISSTSEGYHNSRKPTPKKSMPTNEDIAAIATTVLKVAEENKA